MRVVEHLSGKQKISLAALLGWLLAWISGPFVTIAQLNIENWAIDHGLSRLYDIPVVSWILTMIGMTIAWLYSTFVGPFGLGFVTGGAIFAFWDPAAKRLTGTLFERAKIEEFRVEGFVRDTPESKTGQIAMSFCVTNTSADQSLAFRVVRANLQIDGRVNPDARIGSALPPSIPPGRSQTVTFAYVPNVELKRDYTGKSDIVVRYGRRSDALVFEMQYESDLVIMIDTEAVPPGSRQFSFKVASHIRNVRHIRLPRSAI